MHISMDNPVIQALNRIWNMIFLNILWLICCIPIVTIGASTTALYSMMLKFVHNEEGYIARGFFRGFKENFRHSTIMWICFVAIAYFLYLDWQIISASSGVLTAMYAPIIIIAVLLAGFMIYAFALQARFENTLRGTVKNAFTLLFARLPQTLLMLLILVIPVLLTFFNGVTLVYGVILWIAVGVAAVVWGQCKILIKIFDPLEEQDKEDEEDDSDETFHIEEEPEIKE